MRATLYPQTWLTRSAAFGIMRTFCRIVLQTMSPSHVFPPAGQRRSYPIPHGSADAHALAELAGGGPIVVFTANAQDAQRLAGELAWFNPKLRVYVFPDWETLPYDSFSPHHDLVSERQAALYQLLQQQVDIFLAPVATALTRLAPVAYLAAHTFFLRAGNTLQLDSLKTQLALAGYHAVSQVYSPGEFSVRGGIIDLLPMGSAVPYRIDLFDDEIETIRTFDVDTQRSIYPVKEIRLLPAREFPLDEDGIARFRQNFRATFEGDFSRSRIYKDVSNAIAPAGIEYYLPLFFETTATLFDYIPPEARLILHGDIASAAEVFWRDTQSRYNLLQGDPDRPLLSPPQLFLRADEFFSALKPYPRIEFTGDAQAEHTESLPPLQVERRAENPLLRLDSFIATFKGKTVLLADSLGRREALLPYLRQYGLNPQICETCADALSQDARFVITTGNLSKGFILPDTGLAFITENELFAQQVRQKQSREGKRRDTENLLKDLSEVKPGDPVVHEQHGIGRYLGLISMDLGEGPTELLQLEYAGGDMLYVPVSQLHVISRYSGAAPESAPLHRLGSGQWEKARRKAFEQVRDTAAELLNLYARRQARQGRQFEINEHDYEAFAEGFGFEETPDQAAAIRAVMDDMQSPRPMDRLVCGDVGFGKTEVALRAAFIAVAAGTQVAVLVPTTLLAEQHYQNFCDRFADWPVKLDELSRFRSAKEQKLALQGVADGKVDIIIGTHRLLQEDIRFKNLGLVIIDEEHRFGVRQKEKLKALRAEVDMLTLTATPIPRTLAMSLEGMRDFSVIATAPQKRLAIKTFVTQYNTGIIREAVLRELKRGGQVYFLHNEVDTIHAMREKLAGLLPEARIGVAHGQMPERELEHAMRDFHQLRFNVLLCTTIIETGIDIPNANTILINRADHFGLAQLHQLRGRVGRSHHQAYAYLLTPEPAGLTAQAKKRLEAIQAMEELGAGFYLAMHDLEIRGAGEVLGESQSGEMQEIGFNLYADMLNNAVKALKAGKEPDIDAPLGVTTEINLHQPALLPEDYCGDINERLTLYKRLANCESAEELDELQVELIDRFGLLPEPTQALLASHRLRLQAKLYGITKIDAHSEAVQLHFVPNPPIDPMKLITLIQTRRNYKLNGQDKLKVEVKTLSLNERIQAIQTLLKELA